MKPNSFLEGYEIFAMKEIESLKLDNGNNELVRKQDTIDILEKAIDLWKGMIGCGVLIAVKNSLYDLQPVETPEHKTGRWIYKTTDAYIQRTCSACGWSERMYYRNRNQDGLIRNYCPNCGSYNGGGE